MPDFKLVSSYQPKGDQPEAIEQLVEGLHRGDKNQVLLGVTGSGKTFTIANVVEQVNRPTLVMAHNKTLAAQLYNEFRELFPHNAVEYFVSYYDYYQPEAYIPRSDTYIEKDSSINERIDKMRHSATRALFERKDVLIVASVSCIYGLGSPEAYHSMLVSLEKGTFVQRDEILAKLIDIQYERNDIDFHRGTFRVRGDVVEIFPAYEDERAIRLEFFGDEVERVCEVDPLRGSVIQDLDRVAIYPATHYITPPDRTAIAVRAIESELVLHADWLTMNNKLVEAQRLQQRTNFDLEMIEQIGYCQGIENYSRHLDGREEGTPPPTLLDFFPSNYLMVIDESHASIPQVRGMYKGDRSRKETLISYGFRLPSAKDNRPLKFEEFEERRRQTIFVSATPAEFELEQAHGVVVEQVIRPTGLVDPPIEIRPAGTQVDDLLAEIRKRVAQKERVLITTLTKRMAEDLSEYYAELDLKVKYLHSDIETLERTEIIRQLRLGLFDVLIGINLLREGLDIPEVSLVAILDADKEGFLRSTRSLIQTSGRAARNVNGTIIMYADKRTRSMDEAIGEMERRREIQLAYNKEHGITPESITKSIDKVIGSIYEQDYVTVPKIAERSVTYQAVRDMAEQIKTLKKDMKEAADNLEFELAAEIRDEIRTLEKKELDARG